MNDERRQILSQVAAGAMTPAEAATRLEQIESTQTAEPARHPASSAGVDIRGVRIRSDFGRVIVIGDASVDQATVDGPHTARQEDGVLVIETDQSQDGDFWFGRRGGGHWWDGFTGPTVTVRLNPRLETWINTEAGSVTVRDVLGPIHAEVQAGALAIQGFAGPIDLSTSAGSVRAEGSLRTGSSRIRCQMGSVRITLSPDSDVRVTAFANLGKVSLDNGNEKAGQRRQWGQRQEATYGSGAASLDIESEMGSVTVSRGR